MSQRTLDLQRSERLLETRYRTAVSPLMISMRSPTKTTHEHILDISYDYVFALLNATLLLKKENATRSRLETRHISNRIVEDTIEICETLMAEFDLHTDDKNKICDTLGDIEEFITDLQPE